LTKTKGQRRGRQGDYRVGERRRRTRKLVATPDIQMNRWVAVKVGNAWEAKGGGVGGGERMEKNFAGFSSVANMKGRAE